MSLMKSATTASGLVQKNLFKLVQKLTGMAILTHTQPGCYLYVQHIPGTCITCVHVTGTFYKGHLATKLFVHITQMLWKFRIFPGFPHISEICTAFLHVCDSWQFICAHPADAPEILHFSWAIYMDIRVVFFGFSAHPWDMYCIFTCV